ncbi:hypothetical protein [Variovorax sp. PBL-E5]|uniref:hypothetical protein n=1 Tax=Variovorax sp. PBL-E5 TaxID=434014 RepID=UPI0013175991|nr:hypothetical protein [Variovorax sp. PBL-E5]VTU36164.1 hypothetical protein E5CHR_04245 [Variovorax sp. PBL-E5]
MLFTFKILESLPDAHVIEVECPACHDRWELTRPKDVITTPSRYTVICGKCLTDGYIEL